MSEPNEWTGILQQLQSGEAITAADFLIELRRIADAVEALAGGKAHCDGVNPETGQPCVLGFSHVGYHVPQDGRTPWLDTE